MALKGLFAGKTCCIFDYDGTVVDSMWVWQRVENEYLKSKGVQYNEDINKIIGGVKLREASKVLIRMFGLEGDPETVYQERIALARTLYETRVTIKQGFTDFLRAIEHIGLKTAIGSMLSRDLLIPSLTRFGLICDPHKPTDPCNAIISSDECVEGKPDPEIFLRCMQELGENDPSKCIVFEDSLNGIKAGKAAGMTVIHVRDLHNKAQWNELEQMADGSIASWDELAQMLQG